MLDLLGQQKADVAMAIVDRDPRVKRIDRAATTRKRLEAIPGVVPSLINPPPGCRFAPRCRHAMPACRLAVPPLLDIGGGHKVACILEPGILPQ